MEVRAKKALGQHFLVDLNIARKICNALSGGTPECPSEVLEVGCGMGVLTQFLLQRNDIVTYGAEIDSESVEYLHAHYPEFTPRSLPENFFLHIFLLSIHSTSVPMSVLPARSVFGGSGFPQDKFC